MDRIERSRQKYEKLFKVPVSVSGETDPELMKILRRFIFGEVFYTGSLDDKLRELITIVSLVVQQALPQLKAHVGAALNLEVPPEEIREAVYQCVPFIGFPKILNAVETMNEVFREREISLPLEDGGTVKDSERYEKGKKIQFPIYGDEIKERMKDLPGEFSEAVPRFLTEFCFGDFYTRKTLEIKTRELLILCMLVTMGAEKQLLAHVQGNLRVGNSKETMLAAVVHCLPYIGFPNTLNALNLIKSIEE